MSSEPARCCVRCVSRGSNRAVAAIERRFLRKPRCCEPNSPQGESTMSAVMKEPQISRPVAQFVATAKKLLIDGKWLPAASEKTFEVKNPANGATIARAAEGDKADIDAAVRAARRAFESGPWPAMTASERSKIVWRGRRVHIELYHPAPELGAVRNAN